MKNLLFFSNIFNSGFGGMEVHRDAFVNFFKYNSNYNLVLLSKENHKYYINEHKHIHEFMLLKEAINFLNTFVRSDSIFFFNDFWWMNELKELKQYFYVNKFILRSGGNDILRAPVLRDDVSLSIRQNMVKNIINETINTFIVNSNFSYFQSVDLGIKPEIIKKIRGGVDFDKVDELTKDKTLNRNAFDLKYDTKDKKIITIASRFVPFKGILEFLKETSTFIKSNDCFLLLIGDGPLYNDIEQYLKDNLSNKYALLKNVAHDETLKYLSISDFIINPSLMYKRYFGNEYYYHTETMGRTVMEAISLMVPLIASDVGGVKEAFEEHNNSYIGELVTDFKDFDRIINEAKLIKDNCIARELYSWENLFLKYESLFKEENLKVYCFDIDNSILNKNTDETLIAEYIKNQKKNNIVILNSSRKDFASCERLFNLSNADYLIVNNGTSIYGKKGNTISWNKFISNDASDIFDYVSKHIPQDEIEHSHSHCISLINNKENKEYVIKVLNKFKDYKIIESDEYLKVVHKYYNKGGALDYILKDINYGTLITVGDACNDLAFLIKGDKIFASSQVINRIKNKPAFEFDKNCNKLELLEKIFSYDLVISLTSFPERINCVNEVIESIANQTYKPDLLKIYLSKDEFNYMPNFKSINNLNIEVELVQGNLLGHKKYITAFKQYPYADVITIDDDIFYKPNMVETLIHYHRLFKNNIICNRSRFIKITDNEIDDYYQWSKNVPINYPSLLILPTGVLGVLYPKKSFDDELFNVDNIIKYSISTDDLWLKTHALRNNVLTVLTDFSKDLDFVIGSQDNALCSKNFFSGSNNDNFRNLLKAYNIEIIDLFDTEFNNDKEYSLIYDGNHSTCISNQHYVIKTIKSEFDSNEYKINNIINNIDGVNARKCLGMNKKESKLIYEYIDFDYCLSIEHLSLKDYLNICDYINKIQTIDEKDIRNWDKYKDDCFDALNNFDKGINNAKEIELLNKANQETLIHGDLNPTNIYYKNNNLFVIDYENSYYGPSWWDRCYLLANYSITQIDKRIFRYISKIDIERIIVIIKIRIGRLIRKKMDTEETISRLNSWKDFQNKQMQK